MEKFRWAYIGSGNIAHSTANSILKGDHRIVSVYSRNFEKAKKFVFVTKKEEGFIKEIKAENSVPIEEKPQVDSIFKSNIEMMEEVAPYKAAKIDILGMEKLKQSTPQEDMFKPIEQVSPPEQIKEETEEETQKEKDKRFSNVVFSKLLSIAHNMMDFQIYKKKIQNLLSLRLLLSLYSQYPDLKQLDLMQ